MNSFYDRVSPNLPPNQNHSLKLCYNPLPPKRKSTHIFPPKVMYVMCSPSRYLTHLPTICQPPNLKIPTLYNLHPPIIYPCLSPHQSPPPHSPPNKETLTVTPSLGLKTNLHIFHSSGSAVS